MQRKSLRVILRPGKVSRELLVTQTGGAAVADGWGIDRSRDARD